MHYYKRNLGDYSKKAGRLSMLQHGAYTLLIDSCYDREQFPTRDEAIDWCWASSKEEIEAVEFVLRKFFSLEGGVYVQKRIQEEIAAYHQKSTTNKRIAEERETLRKEKQTNRSRNVYDNSPHAHEPSPNQEPLTKNQEPVVGVPPSAPRTKQEAAGTRLPSDWVLPDEWREWCEVNRPDLDPRLTADSFRDFWVSKPGKDGRKSDWLATWRNWCRGQKPGSGPAKRHSDIFAGTV